MKRLSNLRVQTRFIISIILTALILVAEIIGGLVSGSLALLSDAAHVFSDIFALGLSYFALRLALRPPDDRHSYGWRRAEVIAALVNGASLVVIAVGIWVEAYKRWQSPVDIKSTPMLVIAVIGLLINVVVAFILGGDDHSHDHGPRSKSPTRNLNVQSAFLHVVGDLISSVGVIAAALIIRFTAANWVDPLISIIIGVIILVSAWRVLRKSLHILIEGVPEGLSILQLNKEICSIAGVETVHDLHAWNLDSEHIALSAHILLKGSASRNQGEVMREIREKLASEYDIHHTTLQFEESHCGEGHGGCN